MGVTGDLDGNIVIADTENNCIRRVATNGIITTIAGTGKSGFYGEGIPALGAKLSNPGSITEDDQKNLFIADTGNHIVRKIWAATGIITTVAGIPGSSGYSGDDGPAINALLKAPMGIHHAPQGSGVPTLTRVSEIY